MALVTRASFASLDAISGEDSSNVGGYVAGEALSPVAPCYIASDGLVYESVSTTATYSGIVNYIGFTAHAIPASGYGVELFGEGAKFSYSDGNLTPGQLLWIAATKGELDSNQCAANDTPVAVALDTENIKVIK